ncbi:MAG: oligosaccharyl transferase, archaeosortase A system-associated [Methanoregula sp.]|nr:oligosaccharyl transferase, archaeosortase A system-associated [Methanoregula sp.]
MKQSDRMDAGSILGNPRVRIGILLVGFMGIAFALRMIPALFIGDSGFLPTYDTDGYYTLRQIEVMVHHFPQYNWFDPMTAYPTGKSIDWGPLYPFIAACLCLAAGATSQASVVSVAGILSPILAALIVPVVYFLGKTIRDWQTGLAAAGLAAVLSYHYFFLSSYGFIGHHIAEAFFSTLFFLLYLVAIAYFRTHPGDRHNLPTFYMPCLLAVSAAVCWFCALLASPTVILMLIVIGIYTLVQCILDQWAGRSSADLLAMNAIILSLSAVFLVLFGFHADGITITQYSPGLVYIHLVLLAETVVLWVLSRMFSKKRVPYLASVAVLGVIASAVILLVPPFTGIGAQAFGLFFNSMTYSVGVVETLPLTLPAAWDYFGLSLVLAAGGFLILIYTAWKKPQAESIFLLIWSVVLLLLTARYQRFDYFSTVNIVLLSAICIREPFCWQKAGLRAKISSLASRIVPADPAVPGDRETPEAAAAPDRSGKKKKTSSSRESRGARGNLKVLCLVLVLLLTGILVGVSVYKDVSLGLGTPDQELSADWIESLTWLANTTPATGVDYFGEYPAAGYTYPNGSYGIMGSWTSGHWVTFFAHRIPITNPFQDHLAGSNGAAAYFLAQNESDADTILAGLGGRYVIVDSDLAVDTFTNLVPWATGTTDISPYITWFVMPEPDNPKVLEKVHRYNDGYFQTMAARLYNFDGSLTAPTDAEYVQYKIRQVPAAGESSGDVNGYARVISGDETIDISKGTANLTLLPEGAVLSVSPYAGIYSSLPYEPVATVPALKHYRLVHESPDNATAAAFPESGVVTLPGIKTVKVFEYVKGAQIPGDGTIEVTVRTNTGRTFVYRQASENGTFTVPYSTSGSPYGVTATGPYHILGTTRYVNVTENDVEQGNRVAA